MANINLTNGGPIAAPIFQLIASNPMRVPMAAPPKMLATILGHAIDDPAKPVPKINAAACYISGTGVLL